MFLENLFNSDKSLSKLAKVSCTYNANYDYWVEQLFERIMRLFVWENTETEDVKKSIKPKEIEQRLILAGHCGITELKGELTAMYGSFHGVTKYQDEFKYYNVRCPIHSSSREIGKDVIVINNNSLRNPCYDLIHHYAILLGHVETTLLNCLINVRDSGGVPIASTEKQKQSINAYHTKLFNGEYGVITDSGQLGIEYAGTDRGTRQDILNIMEVREKIIKSFYSDIGVRSAFEKRNNTVMAEVEADTSLLLLNLSDMIDCRKKAADDVNNMFGTNWSVHIAKEIDYSVENERYKFDTDTETHIVEEKNNENYNS